MTRDKEQKRENLQMCTILMILVEPVKTTAQ